MVDYIIRYTGRPVMAQSRILDYDYHKKLIKYYYEDHKTNERIEVTEHVLLFMKKLIKHIPESQFKMVRYYGVYATCMHGYKYKVKLLISKSNKRIPSLLSYRRDLIETFNVDPLLCDCGRYMVYVDNWIPVFLGGEKNGPIYD